MSLVEDGFAAPWLRASPAKRPRLPPSFSAAVYRNANHDLAHLSDAALEQHFVSAGRDEDRVYSTLPRKIKPWLLRFLTEANMTASVRILEAYLQTLNSARVSSLDKPLVPRKSQRSGKQPKRD